MKMFFPVLLAAVSFTIISSLEARPVPRPEMLARFAEEFETDAILHFGLATVANREWGYGDEDPSLFNPTNLDADAIVAVCKEAGIQGLTFVAKHHDGFCLWPTKTTPHNITKSPWKNGKGDLVREFSDACRRGGIKFGIYVSPWDRNAADYGEASYRETYHEQWREVASGAYGPVYQGWFDGANGGDGYYGGAREKRKIPGLVYYDFPTLTKRLKEWNPGFICVGGGDGIRDFRYPGQEDGFCDPDSRCGYPSEAEKKRLGRIAQYKGVADGVQFAQPGCDFPQNPGWFYHPEYEGVSRSGEFLMKIYLNSVGHGGLWEIGLAPRADGSMDPLNVAELRKFGKLKREFFSSCAKKGVFPGGAGTLDVEKPFNVVLLREDLRAGERIDGWELWLDGADGKTRRLLESECVGVKRIRILPERVAGGRIRFVTKKSAGAPLDVECRLYDVDDALLKSITSSTYVPPGGLDLVKHDPMGNIVFTIVISADAGERERFAAEELRRYLKIISGTELPIVTDSRYVSGSAVFLGRTKYTDRFAPGTDYKKLGQGGYRLKVADDHLVIAAGTGDGALNGVYRILQRTANFDLKSIRDGFVPASGSFVAPGDLDETCVKE